MAEPDDNSINEKVKETLDRITKATKSAEKKAEELRRFGEALIQAVKEKNVKAAYDKLAELLGDLKLAKAKIEQYTKEAKKSPKAKIRLRSWLEVHKNLIADLVEANKALAKAVGELNKSKGGLGGKSDGIDMGKIMGGLKGLSGLLKPMLKDSETALKQLKEGGS